LFSPSFVSNEGNMTTNKLELLKQLSATTERHLRETTSLFQNLSDEKLLSPSASGGWSIAQCLAHLNSYGDYYLPEIKKAIDRKRIHHVDNDEVFNSTWLGNYFTRIMDPSTGKKKFKAFKNHVPSKMLDAHVVVSRYIEQQEGLLHYLDESKYVDINDARVPLSIFKLITFKLGDAFRFIIAHKERHMQQAKRNLK